MTGEKESSGTSRVQPWKTLDTRTELANRIFEVKTRTAVSPLTGRPHDFFVLHAGAWVNIIPITPSGQVLLVRQYRHGTEEVTLEIPGGLVESGQEPEEAALRELREETGYGCSSMKLLGRVRPNPAILNNWCYSFLAEPVEQEGEVEFDETEDISLVRVDLHQIPELILSGQIDHSLVLCAFLLFWQKNGGRIPGGLPG